MHVKSLITWNEIVMPVGHLFVSSFRNLSTQNASHILCQIYLFLQFTCYLSLLPMLRLVQWTCSYLWFWFDTGLLQCISFSLSSQQSLCCAVCISAVYLPLRMTPRWLKWPKLLPSFSTCYTAATFPSAVESASFMHPSQDTRNKFSDGKDWRAPSVLSCIPFLLFLWRTGYIQTFPAELLCKLL